ncbi:MAG: hypothetical protein PVH70_17345, partial [Desulfobacterales bacterium]
MILLFAAEALVSGALRGIGRPQALHLVVVIPAGILAALMLYFLPQYRQAIWRISEIGVLVVDGFGRGGVSAVAG